MGHDVISLGHLTRSALFLALSATKLRKVSEQWWILVWGARGQSAVRDKSRDAASHPDTARASPCLGMYRNAYAGAKKYKAGISPPVRRVSRQATGGSRGDVVTVSHLRHWSPCRARQGVGT
ncbi:hypothetical protein GWK47_048862 [Chionoecetes opilio]|uniref:Uncharacterized protein n=1 Tax=Chionoecetes opilio TaxID=41210 RepID=A0A8J5CFH9_CHIOP|nr:hypothetical protein GWK47_048862 [Chionoecetes opilio]